VKNLTLNKSKKFESTHNCDINVPTKQKGEQIVNAETFYLRRIKRINSEEGSM